MMNMDHDKQTETLVTSPTACYHCGEQCPDLELMLEDKYFCCFGCRTVYQLLAENGLCTYYDLNERAGITRKDKIRHNKFAFLDDAGIQQRLIEFRDQAQVYITFYIPYIHCSSCVYLLENLHRLHTGVVRADIHFLKKEVRIIFNEDTTSLRAVVETLASIGYEPHISLQHLDKKPATVQRSLIYRLGVAGFCFGNIMLLSFPEYFAHDVAQEKYLGHIFRYLNVLLALPVFFYSAAVFFRSAWKGLKHGHMNIDAPVALAILVTFIRSLVDVWANQGAGYFDTMSGIIFFMLVGRVLQDKTYGQLSFERDYTDYFPIAATVLKDGEEQPTILPQIKTNDTLRIHNNELIPADGILIKGKAQIDYSFVTGESAPVNRETGELIYAGGRQMGGLIELLVVKEVAQSYLTGLWNKEHHTADGHKDNERHSFVHGLARNFTWVVLAIALLSGLYWWIHEPARIWPAVTAILIIACPCALLLTATFTNGYLLRILGRNGLFLRNAHVIEVFGKMNHLVFDKTGTLTSGDSMTAQYQGTALSPEEQSMVAALAGPTTHPMSKPIKKLLHAATNYTVQAFMEYPGLGVTGEVNQHLLRIGTASFIQNEEVPQDATALYVEIDGTLKGHFVLQQGLRTGISNMLQRLPNGTFTSLLSGDRKEQAAYFKRLLGLSVTAHFEQSPHDKLHYIQALQRQGAVVGMVGDGLNDAGALKQSDIGICVAEDTNNFTPAGDAILEAGRLRDLDKLIKLCSKSKRIITLCFVFSFVYNMIGLYFAVQGLLSPLLAAILMPSSTLSIVLITFISNNVLARRLGLR